MMEYDAEFAKKFPEIPEYRMDPETSYSQEKDKIEISEECNKEKWKANVILEDEMDSDVPIILEFEAIASPASSPDDLETDKILEEIEYFKQSETNLSLTDLEEDIHNESISEQE